MSLLTSWSHSNNHKLENTQVLRMYYQLHHTKLPTQNRIPWNKSTNSSFISFRYSVTTQCGKTKTFLKELRKTKKIPHDSEYGQRRHDYEYGQRVQHFIYFIPKRNSNTKLSFVLRENRCGGSESSKYVEKRCHSNSRTSGRLVCNPKISSKKMGGMNCLVMNLKDLNTNILYLHFIVEGLFLLKEIV